MLVSARSFDEYLAMFGLCEADLRSRVLDCPGGAASFVAEAGARGVDAYAADPQYADDPRRLTDMVLREIAHKHADLVAHAARYRWDWFQGPERYTRSRLRAARLFGADIVARPQRYTAAALPCLPFRDRSFDLVLSSHLLFSYGARLGEEFHLSALVELVRVARREVRLYPLVFHTSNRRHPGLGRLRAALDALGVPSRLEHVGYAFQPEADQVLVLDCSHHGPLPRDRPGADAHDPVRWRHVS